MKFEVPILRVEGPQSWKDDGRAEFLRASELTGSRGLPFLRRDSLVVWLPKVMETK